MLHFKKEDFTGKIISIKLPYGQEAIAKCLGEDDNSIYLENPQVLVQAQDGVGMMNLLFTGNQKIVEISRNSCCARALATPEAAEEYKKILSPVTVTTTPGLIV